MNSLKGITVWARFLQLTFLGACLCFNSVFAESLRESLEARDGSDNFLISVSHYAYGKEEPILEISLKASVASQSVNKKPIYNISIQELVLDGADLKTLTKNSPYARADFSFKPIEGEVSSKLISENGVYELKPLRVAGNEMTLVQEILAIEAIHFLAQSIFVDFVNENTGCIKHKIVETINVPARWEAAINPLFGQLHGNYQLIFQETNDGNEYFEASSYDTGKKFLQKLKINKNNGEVKDITMVYATNFRDKNEASVIKEDMYFRESHFMTRKIFALRVAKADRSSAPGD